LATGAHAQSADWSATPTIAGPVTGTFDYNNPANWSPNTVPGSSGTATFGATSGPNISFSAFATEAVGGWNLTSAAPAYRFDNSSILTFNGAGIVINGGSATISNAGTIIFLNASTAGSATITNSHSLQFSNASSAGNATINNNNVLRFFNTSTGGSATLNNSGLIEFWDSSTTGGATLSNNAGATVGFFNASTAGSATIHNSGLIEFSNSSTAGGATINNSSTIDFFNSSDGASAVLTNTGAAAVVDFSASNGAAGNHNLSVGSLAGAGNFYLGANALTLGSNNASTTVSGVISDCGATGQECFQFAHQPPAVTGGSLIKVGTGTLTLSGTNAYTGPTTVSAGSLVVDGSIAPSSLTTVNSGATLSGSGTVGSTAINTGGHLAPGPAATPGSMTVAGSLTFQSGAFYNVQVTSATASITNVSGAASLAGTVQANVSSISNKTYTILHSGGLGGTTFNGLVISDPDFLGTLSYTPTDVLLQLKAQLGVGENLTVNQRNAANAINDFFNSGGTVPPAFEPFFRLNGNNLRAALDQVSGEAATGAQKVASQLTDQFLDLLLDPFVDGRCGIEDTDRPPLGYAPDCETRPSAHEVADAPASRAAPGAPTEPRVVATPYEPHWTVWATGYGGENQTSGEPVVIGSHDLSARTAAFASGFDYRFAANSVVGFALAGGGTSWSLSQGLGGGNSDAIQVGIYGATRRGPAYLAGDIVFTNHFMSTDRLAYAGDHLQADFNAQSYGGRLEGGYRFETAFVGLAPYAAIQTQSFHTPGYSETGTFADAFALTFASRNATDTRGELGARFDRAWSVNPGEVLVVRARAAWAHDWVSDPSMMPTFQALPGSSFTVYGAPMPRDSALTSLGVELRFADRLTLLAKFDGEFASHSSTYGGTATIRYTW